MKKIVVKIVLTAVLAVTGMFHVAAPASATPVCSEAYCATSQYCPCTVNGVKWICHIWMDQLE